MADMDVKQLQDINKQLTKAADGEPATILRLLQSLQNVTATEDVLRQSRLGLVVSKLRQNKDADVSRLSSQLVNKWKQDVAQAKKRKAAATAASTSAATTPTANKDQMETVKPEPGANRASAAPPDKRSAKADGVNTKLTGDVARDGCIQLMYDGLSFMSEESPDDVLAVARDVELAAFNHHGKQTTATYKQKMRSLFMNLKMKENAQLRHDVYTGRIEATKFVAMTTEELKSAEKRAQDAALEKENMMKAMSAQEERAVSTTMSCSKCKANKVAYTQAQTRSADEPMTTFCECMNCGARWRFS
ncbi:transcription elongation factor [Piedraia hortae CBS 480.64]|uniref:Transcription elongation factor n=1 Tax=Piedraia hortae CBS 480.64 TaxID=1314780 RepID=A0A6A7C6A9_9PEZI|nr:transcription elongation factor [Piedraia hortae CBS 480.64]